MQVQSFRRGIGRDQSPPRRVRTPRLRRRPLFRRSGRRAAADLATHGRDPGAQPHGRIAVFRKNDGRCVALERRPTSRAVLLSDWLAASAASRALLENLRSLTGSVEALSADTLSASSSAAASMSLAFEWQPGLRFDVRRGGHRGQPPDQGDGQSAGAGERAFPKDRGQQRRVRVAAPRRCPQQRRVAFEQPVHLALVFGWRHREHAAADRALRHIDVGTRPAEADEP